MGKRIEDLTLNLIGEMQVMGNSDARVIVQLCPEGCIWGFTAMGIHAVWKLMKIGQGVMPFIAEAIVEIGVRVIQFAVAAFILAINVPIFIYIKKEAAVLMLIINNTDEDMGLDEIVATHGKVVGVFRADKQEENPRLLIPKRLPPVPQQSDQPGYLQDFSLLGKMIMLLLVHKVP